MCVVALAINAHPRWRLVVAGNRDEFHGRPAAPLGKWSDRPDLIAGRDLQSGGTWLGVSAAGRLAVVTNLTGFGPPDPARSSRGALVTDWLTDGALPAAPEAFNPFNLIAVEHDAAQLMSNRPELLVRALPPGLHSLSNGVPGAPWPRRHRLELALTQWLGGPAGDPEDLLIDLADEARSDDAPPVFIRDTVYGTRASTVVAIATDGAGRIVERSFGSDGIALGDRAENFVWPSLPAR